ncbi:MAG: BlaI/MecI/CopY family transcriptional regulator [Verrucomicrobiota bacterium]
MKISEAEWQVMEILWENSPLTAQEVILALDSTQDWKPQTVKTLLNRLLKKGCLEHTKISNRYLYKPALSRTDAVSTETTSFLDRICQNSLLPLLAHSVATNRQLEKEEIEKLRELLDQQPSD